MLIVKKFGGTSVANKERIFNVARRCIEDYKKGNDVVKTDFFSGMIISVCCTVCLLIASLVWFHGWEGGKNSE